MLLKELTLKSYNFFKENTEEKIKEAYENLEKFDEDYNKTPTETDTISIIK